MPKIVFINYSQSNAQVAMRLWQLLMAYGATIGGEHLKLTLGTPEWYGAMQAAMQTADVIVYLASPDAMHSSIAQTELAVAHELKKPVLPFWITGEDWPQVAPPFLLYAQRIDARGARFETGVQELVMTLGLAQSQPMPQAPASVIHPPQAAQQPLHLSPFADANIVYPTPVVPQPLTMSQAATKVQSAPPAPPQTLPPTQPSTSGGTGKRRTARMLLIATLVAVLLLTLSGGLYAVKTFAPKIFAPGASKPIPSGALLWRYRTGEAVEQTPEVVGGVVYLEAYDGTSRRVNALNANTGFLKWSFVTGGIFPPRWKIAQGVAYIATLTTLYAVNVNDGTLLWKVQVNDAYNFTVVHGIVYLGYGDEYLAARNARDGSLLWGYRTGGSLDSDPLVVGGVVYFFDTDSYLYAINITDATLLWKHQVGDGVEYPQIMDGVVYAWSFFTPWNLTALDAHTGALLWSHQTVGSVIPYPFVVNGVVYIVCNDGILTALDAGTGKPLWNFQTGDRPQKDGGYSFPVVAGGVLYMGSGVHHVYALDASTGSLKWTSQVVGSVIANPVVGNGGVYIGSLDHSIYALDTATGSLKWEYQTGDQIQADIQMVNGIIYVGSFDGYMYALKA